MPDLWHKDDEVHKVDRWAITHTDRPVSISLYFDKQLPFQTKYPWVSLRAYPDSTPTSSGQQGWRLALRISVSILPWLILPPWSRTKKSSTHWWIQSPMPLECKASSATHSLWTKMNMWSLMECTDTARWDHWNAALPHVASSTMTAPSSKSGPGSGCSMSKNLNRLQRTFSTSTTWNTQRRELIQSN